MKHGRAFSPPEWPDVSVESTTFEVEFDNGDLVLGPMHYKRVQ